MKAGARVKAEGEHEGERCTFEDEGKEDKGEREGMCWLYSLVKVKVSAEKCTLRPCGDVTKRMRPA